MKNKLIILILALTFSTIAFSQSIESREAVTPEIPTNIERYNVDYKIVEEHLIESDSSILNSIDLFSLENYRNETATVTVDDSQSGLQIILFAEKKKKSK